MAKEAILESCEVGRAGNVVSTPRFGGAVADVEDLFGHVHIFIWPDVRPLQLLLPTIHVAE